MFSLVSHAYFKMESNTMPNTGSSTEHAIGLKVVRFSKPGLMNSPIIMGEPWDPIGASLGAESNKDVRVNEEIPGLGISDLLELHQIPSGKDNLIYLGETYRVFVSLSNESYANITDVVMKVEMITPSNRHLLHQSPPTSVMTSGQRMDHVLSHDVKDMGEHTLVCTVSYSLSSGEEKLLKKLLQFSVSKPLEVRPDYHFIEDDFLFSIQIQNVMHHPVYLEVVSFDPAAGLTSDDYNITPSGASVFSQNEVFYPRTTRQYLYRISPQMKLNTFLGGPSKNISVGKLDIVWRGRFGERGRIQTGQLKVNVPPPAELEVTLSDTTGKALLERVSQITLNIINNSDNTLRLRYSLEKAPNSGLIWTGVTNKILPDLPSRDSTQLTLNILPTVTGLQTISSLTLTDLLTNQKFSFNKIGSIFVQQVDSASSKPHPLNLINTIA